MGIFRKRSRPYFWIDGYGANCRLRRTKCSKNWKKTEKLSKGTVLRWVTKVDANFQAVQRMDPMTISWRRPFPSSELQRLDLEEQSSLLGNIGLEKLMLLQISSWSFVLALSGNENIPISLFYAHAKQNERKKSCTFGATESPPSEQAGNQKKCRLFGSSIIFSSLTFVSLLTLHRFCDFTQMLFMWWLWNYRKPRFVDLTKILTKSFPQMRCIGGYKNCK